MEKLPEIPLYLTNQLAEGADGIYFSRIQIVEWR